MSEQIRELFTSIAPTYDRLNHLLSWNADKRWRKQTISRIVANPLASFAALDLCAGTLDLSIEFLKRFPRSEVWAVDFSQTMLDYGRAKVSPENQKRLHTVCADAINLPFPDGKFDLLFCGYGFRNLDNQEEGLAEMRRVLKPGGQLLILEFFRPTRWETRFFHQSYGQIVLPLIGRLVSGRPKAYRYLHDSIGNFYSAGECKKVLEKQYFNNIDCKDFFMGVSSLIVGYKM